MPSAKKAPAKKVAAKKVAAKKAVTRRRPRTGPAKATVAAGVPTEFEPPTATVSEPELPRDESYLRLLLLLLISAAFFEGYDSSILALLLSDIQSTFP